MPSRRENLPVLKLLPPHSINYGAIVQLLDTEIGAIMLGEKDMDSGLKAANNQLKKLLR